jgi:mannitol-specific phosphotransferase system IIBC component
MSWIILVTATALIIVIGIYGLSHGNLYRRPYILIISGILIGIVGAGIAYVIAHVGSIPQLADKFPHSDLGASIITVLVSSISGSLFASAILLKSERLHKEEIQYAQNRLESARKLGVKVLEEDNRLNELAKSMGTKEYWVEYKKIRNLELLAIDRLIDAESKLEDLIV